MSGPKSQDFSLIQTFDTHKEFNEYLIAENIYFATEKSSLINCSMCRSKTHKLRYKIGRCNDNTCNNTDEPCERKVKILYCQKREHVALYGKGVHRAESKDRMPKHYGISETVKEKLEDLICNYESRPLRLHLKLEKLKRKQKIEIDHMPTLKQMFLIDVGELAISIIWKN
jgi:hypothetical protein